MGCIRQVLRQLGRPGSLVANALVLERASEAERIDALVCCLPREQRSGVDRIDSVLEQAIEIQEVASLKPLDHAA
jgi:hypothetical protein